MNCEYDGVTWRTKTEFSVVQISIRDCNIELFQTLMKIEISFISGKWILSPLQKHNSEPNWRGSRARNWSECKQVVGKNQHAIFECHYFRTIFWRNSNTFQCVSVASATTTTTGVPSLTTTTGGGVGPCLGVPLPRGKG